MNKLRQIKGRRKNFAELTRKPEEKLVNNDFFETVTAYNSSGDYFFINPGRLNDGKNDFTDYSLIRLRRSVPLSIYDNGSYAIIEEI